MTVPEGEQSARDGLFSFLSRRRFLKASLVAGGALLGVGGGGLFILRGRAPKIAGLQVLDAHEYQTVQSLVEIMFP
ncbi:MAG: twin-arginine translocation signal domain-containing protein, partial [Deltaproteobacteria bacterium]|nr:twin-arginine translocation signal domain-containing protein [Deltaproteobacteria bacterium]